MRNPIHAVANVDIIIIIIINIIFTIKGAKPNPRGCQRGRLRGLSEVVGRDHLEERAGNSQLGRHPLTEGDHRKRDAGVNVCLCCP